MPNASTIFDWIDKDEDFAKRYAHARTLQAEALAEEIVDLSDKAFDRDSAACAKVQVEARKWVAAKLLPSKYGEKPNETHISTTVNNLNVVPVEQLKAIQERRRMALEQ